MEALAFNHTSAATPNLVAAVAAEQVNVYDDMHVGDHVSLVAQLPREHTDGGVRVCVCAHLLTLTHGLPVCMA